MEHWIPVAGYEGWYSVSNVGRVRRVKQSTGARKGLILKAKLQNKGYLAVNLSKNGIARTTTIHSIVAHSFFYKNTEKLQINHRNGIKTDNRVENLEFVTQSQNTLHAYRNGLCKPGNQYSPRREYF